MNQTVDHDVYDLTRRERSVYSPTGNSWNQSDIDSEYHRYDPERYPARVKQEQQNPQESESVANPAQASSQVPTEILHDPAEQRSIAQSEHFLSINLAKR